MIPTPDLVPVIDGGYCVGCGVCAGLDQRIVMRFDRMQRLQAEMPKDNLIRPEAAAACPFADGTMNEDSLARVLFDAPKIIKDARIGLHLATFAGWVEDDVIRARASSGGIGSWLQAELLDKGLVDAVINVTAQTEPSAKEPLFRFAVARNRAEILGNAKTRYYPVEMSGVIRHILETPGRYAVIGVPCFAKALRLAALQEPVLANRLRFVLGIVCGHMKSAAFADALALQMGVQPDQLTAIDFRTKLPGRPASRYGITIEANRNGEAWSGTRPMEGLVGANWGHGFFKLKACEFCDDVMAETADAVVGDAWLPSYDADPRGANVLIVRNPDLLDLVETGAADRRLHLDTLSAEAVADSQAGGLRHRREGLAYRLWLTDRSGNWRPHKRVRAMRDHLDPNMQRIQEQRFALGQASHAAFAQANGDMQMFFLAIKPLQRRYDSLMAPSLARRITNLLERKFIRILNLLMGSSPKQRNKK